MFAFLRKVDHTTSRKTRKGRNFHNKRPGFEPLEGRVVLDAAGSTLGTAQNIGALIGRRTFSDSIGFFDFSTFSTDTLDFRRFSLTNPGSLNVRLDGLSADADLQVIRDINNNGVVDSGEVLGSSTFGGTTPDVVNLSSLPAGNNYFARVNQFSGATNYNLTLTADYAGNSTAAARNLGTLLGRQSVSDFVGSIDTQDFYRINLAAPGSLNVLLNGLGADADLQVLNSAGTIIASSANGGTTPDSVNLTSLAAGTYFVRVNQFIGDTNYNLTLTADYAGNSTAAARNLGTFFGTRVFSDFVGAIDTNDFYRINLPTFRTVTGTISGLVADADLNLLNAFGSVIASSTNGGNANDSISRFLVPGTYYFQVYRYSSAETNYNFTLTT
jgi:hypothetical protein